MPYIVTSALFGFGLFLLLSNWLHLPSTHAVKALAALDSGQTPMSEVLAGPLARRLAHFLPMAPYRKRRLQKELSLAGMDMTPEYYLAFAVVMGIIASIPSVMLFIFAAVTRSMIFGLFGTVFLFVAVLLYWLETHRTGKRAKQYREELEAELPKLTAAVKQGLQSSPDIYYILNRYRDVAGKTMRRELGILLADMATGDRVIALGRFEARLASEHASSLVRALVGIERGEDMQAFLNDLDVQLRDWELNQLRKEAAKRPDELRPANLALIGSMLALYAVLFGTEIWNSIQVFMQT